jgi:hypothetical protein
MLLIPMLAPFLVRTLVVTYCNLYCLSAPGPGSQAVTWRYHEPRKRGMNEKKYQWFIEFKEALRASLNTKLATVTLNPEP